MNRPVTAIQRTADRPRRRRSALLPLVCLSLAGAFAGSCVVTEPTVTGQSGDFAYTWEKERQIGAEADRNVVDEMGLYPDDDLQAYVASVGQRVLEHSDLRAPDAPQMYRDTPFTFRVVNSTVVNAFALPGGYVYVTRGLLSHVQNEAQLALVLGHEIGHVAARHASQQAVSAQRMNVFMGIASIASQVLVPEGAQDLAQQVLQASGQGLGLLMLKYSREAESEADLLGVRYASRTGYATEEGVAFFRTLQRMSEAEGNALPDWASSHPDPGDRAVRLRQLSQTYRTDSEPIVGERQFLDRIGGMVVGDNPREGFEDGGIFYHPDLRLQFPVIRGWKLQNETSAVVQVAPNQGAVIGFQLATGSSPRDALAQFARESQVQVLGVTDRSINGLSASLLVGQAQSQQGATGVWGAFVEYDGRVFQFIGLSAAATFSQYRGAFESVAFDFRALRDERRLSVQPARLTVQRTDHSGRIEDFLPRQLPAGLTVDDIAIMNQVERSETLPAGRLIKVPVQQE